MDEGGGQDEEAAEEIKAEKKALFLAALAKGCSVTAAVEAAAPISKMSIYRWRRDDSAFAAAWLEALEEGVDKLEDEARRRAYEGVERPVYRGGQRVGTVREYSDNLLMFLLKAHRPHKYRERTAIEHSAGPPLEKQDTWVAEMLQAIEDIVRHDEPKQVEHDPHSPSPTNGHGERLATSPEEDLRAMTGFRRVDRRE